MLIERQPPSPPAVLIAHEMDEREIEAAPSNASAPPDAAAVQIIHMAELTVIVDDEAAVLHSSAPLPPVSVLVAEMANSCAETNARRAMHPPLAVADVDAQTMLVSVGVGKLLRDTAAPAATVALVTVKEETRSCAYGDAVSEEKTPQPPTVRTQPVTATRWTRKRSGNGLLGSVMPAETVSVMQTAPPLPPFTPITVMSLMSAMATLLSRTPTPHDAYADQRGGRATPTEETLARAILSMRA
jgi:hypothetical protein